MSNAPDGDSLRCDLLVIGSGAGGLAAAVAAARSGLKVTVVEKEPVIGGASARSGGWLWIPGNSLAKQAGRPDSRAAAETYIRACAGDQLDEARMAAFLDHGPEAVDFFMSEASVRFRVLPDFPDYYPETPGGSPGGRSIFPPAVSAKIAGADLKRLRPTLVDARFLGMQIGTEDGGAFLSASRNLRSALYVARRLLRLALDFACYGRSMRLTGGNALIAQLMAAFKAEGGTIITRAAATSLTVEDGKVVGATITIRDRPVNISAPRGVILACGGFPHDPVLRAELFPTGAKSPESWAVMPWGNSGDGIALGVSVGGDVVRTLHSPIALGPIMRVDVGEGRFGGFPIFYARGAPGSIAVNLDGKRFVNEAQSYHVFGRAMLDHCRIADSAIAYIISDSRAVRKYGLGRAHPWPMPRRRLIRTGELIKAPNIAALAAATGIDLAGLQQSIDDFNQHARQGRDPEFGRGESLFDATMSDPSHRPNPNLGPLETGPFYAIRVHAGALGTFAGLRTDACARVVRGDDTVVDGLYAVGNDQASVTGGDYIGGGCTIGPAMTFGYLAGRHAAQAA